MSFIKSLEAEAAMVYGSQRFMRSRLVFYDEMVLTYQRGVVYFSVEFYDLKAPALTNDHISISCRTVDVRLRIKFKSPQ